MGNHGATLVTGASGFIGSHLVDRLIADGHHVRALVRRRSDPSFLHPRAEVVVGDVTRPLDLIPAARDVDLVFHVAGQIAAVRDRDYERVNRFGTRDLVRAVRKGSPGLRRIVLVSSLAAVGPARHGRPLRETDAPRPVSRYGQSKLAGERAARAAAGDVPVTVVRPPIVYGPRDRGSLSFFRVAASGLAPSFAHRKVYSVLHVSDLVRGLARAAALPHAAGRTYHLADPKAYSFAHLLRVIAAELRTRLRFLPLPDAVLRVVARVSDGLSPAHGPPARSLTDKVREILPDHWVADPARAREELGFRTRVGLPAGIREAAGWYREWGWIDSFDRDR